MKIFNKFFALMLAVVVITVMTVPVSAEAGRRHHSRHRHSVDVGDVAVAFGVLAAATTAAVIVDQAFGGHHPYPRGYDRGYDRWHERYDRRCYDRHPCHRREVVVVVVPQHHGHHQDRDDYRWQYQR